MKGMKVILLALVLSVTVGSNIHTEPSLQGSPTENPQSLIIEEGEVSWQTGVVDNDAVKGWTSIALDSNNYPHISYTGYDAGGDGLVRYAYYTGTVWRTEVVDTGIDHQDQNTSIAIDSLDYPHISFSETNYDDVWYAEKTSGSWNVVVVDYSGNVGTYSALALDSLDYPHISYYDGGDDDRDLKYAFWDGSSWNTEKPRTHGDVGRHTSIAIDSNNYPHISCHYADGNDVLYIYKDATGWHWDTAGDTNYSESYTSIALDENDLAFISYRYTSYLGVTTTLKCAKRTTGGGWQRWDVASSSLPSIGKASAIAVDNSPTKETIHIAFHGSEPGSPLPSSALNYIYYYGDWQDKEIVDSNDDLDPLTVDIAIDDASPRPHVHISYCDEINQDLKYALRNNVPWVTDVSISPELPTDDDDLVASYTYHDGNGDPSTGTLIRWFVNGGHEPAFNGHLVIPADSTALGDQWEFSVTPNDGYDIGTEVSSTVRINALPVASNVQLTPTTAYTNNPLIANYDYYDANGDEEDLTQTRVWWFYRIGGGDWNTYGNYRTVPAEATRKHQEWYFSVRPHDGHEYGLFVESNHVTILNTVPTISPPILIPTRPATTQDIELLYTFYDADANYPGGDTDQSLIRWWRTTSSMPEFDDQKIIPWTATSAGEYWEVVVVPYDGEAYNDQQSADPYATVNYPPYAWNYRVEPANPGDDDDLTAYYEFIDWDTGDVENTDPVNGTQIRWYKDSGGGPILQPGYNNQLTVSKDDTTPGEDWHFTVRPHDYIEYGDTATSDPPTRINNLPIISNLSLTPATPYTTDPLTAIYDFFDADDDDDHSEFIWYIDGEGEQTGYNDNPLPAGVAKKGEQWYVTVNSFDGHEYGNSLTSSTVTVINSPPAASNPYISPCDPIPLDDLVVNYTYADADADPKAAPQVRWYKDTGTGPELQPDYNDQLMIPSSNTSLDEVWYFTLRPYDGDEFGNLVTSPTVTIVPNILPEAMDPSLTPEEPLWVDDLFVDYTYYDGNCHPESGTEIRWYKNGVLETDYNNSKVVPASATTGGDSLYCTIRPYDGYEFGTTEILPAVTIQGKTQPLPRPRWEPASATAISSDTVVTWGANYYGQCNVLMPNEGLVAIDAGKDLCLGLKSNGTIVTWGQNDYGQCDFPAPNADFVAVVAGEDHGLGLMSNGSIIAWGKNDYGQCDIPVPNESFVAVAAGGNHSLGLKHDGTIVAWGSNSCGQCDVPAPNTDFVSIASGGCHNLGLKSDGTIVAWGSNSGGKSDVPAPNTNFVAVAAGYFHSLGLKSDGTIVAWGRNDHGQCDVPVPNIDFVAVDGGYYHSLGLTSDGRIVAWGRNDHGQCDVPEPNTNFAAVNAGYYHNLGLKSDGMTPTNPLISCPTDSVSVVPAFSTIPKFLLNGFAITNSWSIPVGFSYEVTFEGPATLTNNRDPRSLAAITPPIMPGKSYAPPLAILSLPAIRSYSEEHIHYRVSVIGHPDLIYSCTSTIVFEPPVAAAFEVFNTEPMKEAVSLHWEFSWEEPIAGFYVYRSPVDGAFIRITQEMLGPGTCEYYDKSAAPGSRYRYMIAAVTQEGREIRSFERAVQAKASLLALYQNYPNPFNPNTTISFVLPEKTHAVLSIYDIEGKLVKILISEFLDEGYKQATWDGTDSHDNLTSSGIYFYRLTAGNRTLTKKMVLLK